MREVLTRLPSTRACCYLYPLCEHPLTIGDFHASMETKAPVAARSHMMRVKRWKIYMCISALFVNAFIERGTVSQCALQSDLNVCYPNATRL